MEPHSITPSPKENHSSGASDVEVRELQGNAEFEMCSAFEEEIWGQHFSECVPAGLLMVGQKMGGLTAGAFDGRGRMVGMVFGLTGLWNGKPSHWSHMMAVAPSHRGQGLGRQLKAFQRSFLLAQGIHTVRWTYDPLETVNAHLNMNVLGALPIEYLRDVYGSGETSSLHRGIGTDRFVLLWRLMDPRVVQLMDHTNHHHHLTELEGAPIVNVDHQGKPLLMDGEPGDVSSLRVEVPNKIQTLKIRDPRLALAWRSSTRRALLSLMGQGFRVERFYRNPQTKRFFYVLNR